MNTFSRALDHRKGGVRLYIAIATAATTLEIWWWAYASYNGTSFDKAFTAMGIWWFRLHRFVYVGLHVFRQKSRPSVWQLAGLTATTIALFTVFNYGYSKSQQPDSAKDSYATAR